MVEYEIEYVIPITPIYMIVNRAVSLDIALSAVDREGIIVDSLTIYNSEYTAFAKEPIFVFEQKFIVSTSDQSNNTSTTHLDNNLEARDGFGPIVPATVEDNLFSINKLRGYGSSEKYQYEMINYGTKLPVEATIDNLYTIEYDLQKEIYMTTCFFDLLGDSIMFTPITPPMLKDIVAGSVPVPMVVESKKMTWDTLGLAKEYKSYAFWSPGGHYWKWSDSFTMQNCYVYGVKIEKIYMQQLVCVLHAGNGTLNVFSGEFAYYSGPAIYANLVYLFTGWH